MLGAMGPIGAMPWTAGINGIKGIVGTGSGLGAPGGSGWRTGGGAPPMYIGRNSMGSSAGAGGA